MACRIGISTDPDNRIKYWKEKEGHTHSKILARKLTFGDAQIRESEEAKNRGCISSPGGNPGNDRYNRVWSVYNVWGR